MNPLISALKTLSLAVGTPDFYLTPSLGLGARFHELELTPGRDTNSLFFPAVAFLEFLSLNAGLLWPGGITLQGSGQAYDSASTKKERKIA